MSISHWPPGERPREKLLQRGAASLSDAELLAIFLRTGLPGMTAVDLARDLLARYGSLRSLFEANHRRFCDTPGLGPAKYAQLQAVLEMVRRYLHENLRRGDALRNPADTRNYLSAQLRGRDHEVFACLFLDTRHRVIAFEEVFRGTIDGASVHPREIVKLALAHNAAAVILAHNHPSGISEPSQADIRLTGRLRDALALVDVRVLDHLIVGDGLATSLAELGMM
ncbi:MAG: DNA repair protein RadC [Gammaproteobacteria bacterium]|jgi:DNA repair protein RadC|nr:DNA repair protein RadC [Gammaproteobacteria bacterium]